MSRKSELNPMRVRIVALAAAILSWGAAVAQTGPSFAPLLLAQAPPADATADIWSHMTPQQRGQLWQQLTPEERARIWQRLPAEQRRAITERLAPEQRERPAPGQLPVPRTMPPAPPGPGPELRGGPFPGPGPKLSPEERRQLREQIRQAHGEFRRGRRP
jgi:MgtE intracellular N domain